VNPAIETSPRAEALAGLLARLAEEWAGRVPALAEQMAVQLQRGIPELAERDDPELHEELRASCEANMAQILRLLRRRSDPDDLVMPPEAREFVRGLVRRGIGLPVLLRSYRLGHAYYWDVWSDWLREHVLDAAELVSVLDRSSTFLFGYVDLISAALVEDYVAERERLVRTAQALRAETVQAVLSGEAIDPEMASGRLGYELRRHHLAMRVSGGGPEGQALERVAIEAGELVGSGPPLVVPAGAAVLDVWCGCHRDLEERELAALEDFRPPEGIRLAIGHPGAGVEGFRDSHAEAVQASRLAAIANGHAPAVISYRRVELATLLACDLPRAKRFVARWLGPLAVEDDQAGRLRETLFAFLRANRSGTRVARQLYVHQNTVAYRVHRAEELLGRPVSDNQAELMCALMLVEVLGPSVLAPPGA
jgi:PucR C-terminal helix-turn-helix domain/GGDEF-like domain